MNVLIIIVLLFIILAGGGWLLGKSISSILFKTNYNNNYSINQKVQSKTDIITNNYTNTKIEVEKPNYKIPLEGILKKIETITFQSKNNNTSIYFDNVTLSNCKYLPMYYDSVKDDFLGISFKISDNLIFIEIAISDKNIILYKGSELLFYFENNEIIKYTFTNSCIKGHNYNINLIIPNIKELELFAFQNLEYWNLKFAKKGLNIEGNNTYFDIKNRMSEKKDFQETLKYLTNKIVNELIIINKNKLKSK